MKATLKGIGFRASVVLLLLGFLVTPFWRGGRDETGYLAAAAALFIAWFLWSAKKQTQKPLPAYLGVTLSFFVIFLMASSVWASNKHVVFLKVLALVFAVLVFFIVRQVSATKKFADNLPKVIVLWSIPVMIYGIYLYYATVYDRAASFFYAPNEYALYLLVVWLAALKWWQKRPHISLDFLLFAIASQFFLTQSLATTALALVATLVAVRLLKYPIKQIAVLALIIAAGFGLAVTLGRVKNMTTVSNIGTPDQVSELAATKASGVRERFDYWQSSSEIFTDNIFTGVGLDNFQSVYPQYQKDPGLVVENPHNFYIQTFAEGGVLGGWLMSAVLIAIAVFWYRGRKDLEFNYVALMVAVILLHLTFYQSFRYPTIIFMLALLLGYWTTYAVKGRKVKVPLSFNQALTMASFCLLLPAGLYFRADSFSDKGSKVFQQRDMQQAIEYYEKSAKLPFDKSETYRNMAIAKSFTSDFDGAIAAADQAIKLDPENGQNFGARAFALELSKSEPKLVKESYEKSIKLNPFNSPDVYRNYINYLLSIGERDRPKQLVDFILPYYDDATLQKREGIDDLRRRVGLLQFQSARVHAALGDQERIVKDLERTVELYPEFAIAQSLLDQIKNPKVQPVKQ